MITRQNVIDLTEYLKMIFGYVDEFDVGRAVANKIRNCPSETIDHASSVVCSVIDTDHEYMVQTITDALTDSVESVPLK